MVERCGISRLRTKGQNKTMHGIIDDVYKHHRNNINMTKDEFRHSLVKIFRKQEKLYEVKQMFGEDIIIIDDRTSRLTMDEARIFIDWVIKTFQGVCFSSLGD